MDSAQTSSSQDLVGGPFAVIESDPGVFTSLTRRLGIDGLELVELYDIEPWAVDHLQPHGLIFCFMWTKDTHRPGAFSDPAAERVWFANQLSDDACATHAILNVLLNCPGIDIGEELRSFRKETERMTPVMRGLAITNSPIIRPAHNFFARPSDLRASLNSITITTFDAEKEKDKEQRKATLAANANATATESTATVSVKPPPAKRAKLAAATKSPTKAKAKGKGKQADRAKAKARAKGKGKDSDEEDEEDGDEKAEEAQVEEETYHFIGYVPAHGKVWELDGLKSGPLEVGELPPPGPSSASTAAPNPNAGWMDVARPALRMKMEKYGGSGTDGSNIRFSLLAIVDDGYTKASDEFELLKRERVVLERRMREVMNAEEWQSKVDPALLASSQFAFALAGQTSEPGRTFARDFGARKQARDLEVLNMSDAAQLTAAWEGCVERAMRAKIGVEDELAKAVKSNTDHAKRTFDYEPFIREYIHALHREALLNSLLDRDDDGRKLKKTARKGAGGSATTSPTKR